MSKMFFADLKPIPHYNQIARPELYSELPEDWVVVLTDVKGSTKAIEAGRYKQVNMVGVSTIVAAQNVLGDLAFPFIFGGDGATLAIPPEKLDVVKGAMSHARAVAKNDFGLGLRVALIPARAIAAAGGHLSVAKLQISAQQSLALVRGTGWAMAESWMKEREAEFSLAEDYPPSGDFSGLECRWNPLPASKDEMMALIIQSRVETLRSQEIYARILDEILDPSLKPVTLIGLPLSWPPKNLHHEAKWRTRHFFERLTYLLAGYSKTLLACVVLKLRGSKRNVAQPIEYLRELTENTDYIKFDECLRMVIDVSAVQKKKLLDVLESHRAKGEIFFGYHCDAHALMTCYVQGPHKHIHFIDAAGGGYAMAAKQLKAMRQSR